MNSNTKNGLIFLAGAIAGVVAGLLLAPKKGSETRKLISGKAKDFSDAIIEKATKGFRIAEKTDEIEAKQFVD